jgi:hypothetical protein
MIKLQARDVRVRQQKLGMYMPEHQGAENSTINRHILPEISFQMVEVARRQHNDELSI